MRRTASLIGAFSVASFGLVNAATTEECCALIGGIYPDSVFFSGSEQYETENANAWSVTNSLRPGCIFMPSTTEMVSVGVALFSENQCRFALKGGGHSGVPGANSIHDGILMPSTLLTDLEIDLNGYTIRTGMGNRMGNLYNALDQHNLTSMLGRYEGVGLGVALGAGLSYLINKNGLLVDNIANAEVVLANGTVVNANATSNPDLFKALKGGGNNFGVVTHLTIYTEPTEGAVYGGIIRFEEQYFPNVTHLMYDYCSRQAVDDIYTHVIPHYAYNGTTGEAYSWNMVVYNKDVHELPEILSGWEDVPSFGNTIHNRNYSSMAHEIHDGFPNQMVQQQRAITTYPDEQLFADMWAMAAEWYQQWQHIEEFVGLHTVMPVTPRAIQQGVEKGGNSLGLEGVTEPLAITYFGVTFPNIEDAPELLASHAELIANITNMVTERGHLHPYIMTTYSSPDQNVISSYGSENIQFLYETSLKYDPKGVFQYLVPGGHKIPGLGLQV